MLNNPSSRLAGLAIWRCKVDPRPLADGMTNRNFVVEDAGRRYVVRVASDVPVHGLVRAAEHAASRAAAQAGISPAVRHTAAYWLLHTLKGPAPKTSFWCRAQFDTICLAFIKIAARVTELVTRIKVSLPSSYPH